MLLELRGEILYPQPYCCKPLRRLQKAVRQAALPLWKHPACLQEKTRRSGEGCYQPAEWWADLELDQHAFTRDRSVRFCSIVVFWSAPPSHRLLEPSCFWKAQARRVSWAAQRGGVLNKCPTVVTAFPFMLACKSLWSKTGCDQVLSNPPHPSLWGERNYTIHVATFILLLYSGLRLYCA